MQRGDWWLATWNGEPWFHKPPLVIAATSLWYGIFGVGELAPRLTSALCGVAGVVALYLFLRRTDGPHVALTAALILVSTPHYLRFAKMGMLDVPLTFFVSLALFAWWLGSREQPRWLVLSGVAFGLAFMTKGVAAGIAPLAVAIDIAIWRRWRLLREPSLWLGAALAAAIVVPWHAIQLAQHGRAFLDEYLFYHVVARSFEPIEGHAGGPLFYLAALVDNQRPWFLLGFAAMPWALGKAISARDERLGFFLSWIAAVAIVTLAVQTKLDWYVMPAYPALSACIAIALAQLVPRRYDRVVVGACALVLVGHLLRNVADPGAGLQPRRQGARWSGTGSRRTRPCDPPLGRAAPGRALLRAAARRRGAADRRPSCDSRCARPGGDDRRNRDRAPARGPPAPAARRQGRDPRPRGRPRPRTSVWLGRRPVSTLRSPQTDHRRVS